MEKELILEEVTGLCERLHKQTIEGRVENTEIAGKLNELANKIKTTNRSLMAKSSELAMIQNQCVSLQREANEKVYLSTADMFILLGRAG